MISKNLQSQYLQLMSFGEQIQNRARILLEALLDYDQQEHSDCFQQILKADLRSSKKSKRGYRREQQLTFHVSLRQQGARRVVKATLYSLERLPKVFGKDALTKYQVEAAIDCLKKFDILENLTTRGVTERELILKYKDRDEVLRQFEEACKRWEGGKRRNNKNSHVDEPAPTSISHVAAAPVPSATVTELPNALASSDRWKKVCREMLESQQQSIRRQATEIVSEPFYVQLGLVERRHQPRRNNDFSISPEQGSGFFQLDKEEIIETYEHDEFLEQVIQQGQSKKSQGKRIAIIGEPGAGKTTLLEASAFSPLTSGFPIWISLGSLGEKSLEEYLCQKWLKDALKTSDVTQQHKQLEELFKSGEVLLLLDGVDEMPAPSPVEALAKIREELTGWVAEARVVLTCRVNVWDASVNALQGFDTYRTLEFSYGDGNKPDQVREFICQWFSKTDKPDLGEPLRERLDEDRHQRIRDLVKNPLRLSLLCQSWYFHQGDLPKTKAALYEQFTRTFYDWKEEQFSTSPTKRKELNEKLGLLAREAIDKEKSRFGIREGFAIDVMGEDLFNLGCKLHWLNFVYNITETNEKVYAFFHPTLQEYFAANAIDDWDYFLNHNNDNPNPFVQYNNKDCVYHIFEPHWKEVILLWLGREDVAKENKDKFIQALIEFEDDCWDLYCYRAFFLAGAGIAEFTDCIHADEIVESLIEWSTEHKPTSRFEEVINRKAWDSLLETERLIAINALIQVFFKEFSEPSSFLDDDIWWRVFNTLKEIATGNSGAIAVISNWINNILLDENFLYEDLRNEAALLLGHISPNKREAIEFLKQQFLNNNLPENERYQAAHFMIELDQYNPDVIRFWTECINQNYNHNYRFQAAHALAQIDSDNPLVINTLTELLNWHQGDDYLNIPLLAACQLIDIESEHSEAIKVIRDFIQEPNKKSSDRLMAANYLGKTQQGKQEAIEALYNLLDEILSDETIETSQRISLGDKVLSSLCQLDPSIRKQTKDSHQNNNQNIDYVRSYQEAFSSIVDVEKLLEQLKFARQFYSEDNLEEVLYYSLFMFWLYANEIPYPDFYKALHPESSRLQSLENQLIDISSQVQPTDKTYPITLDTQSLKLETNTSAIAQKLCTKIYRKAGYSEIPTVNDAAQLQQQIPRIQEQLQKPNLALILHGCEPNEHLINFCYSLADRDLRIYIGLITSKPIEQPLKGFLPNQDNLLSAIQSWINEIG